MARALSEILSEARDHVGGGWSEPLSYRSDGRICCHDDEGISLFCVDDALAVAARGDIDAWMSAEDLLVEALYADDGALWRRGNHHLEAMLRREPDRFRIELRALSLRSLHEWLEAPSRPVEEVVVLFGRAMARARVLETKR